MTDDTEALRARLAACEDIVNRVAAKPDSRTPLCYFCMGLEHTPDCTWVLARKLVGK